MRLIINPGRALILKLLILFFISELVGAPRDNEALVIGLDFTEKALCPGDSDTVPIRIYLEGTDQFLWLEHNGITKYIFFFNNPFVYDTLYEPGVYTILRYGNSTEVDSTTQPQITISRRDVDLYLSGGGTGCTPDQVSPIIANFSGYPPWTLTYELNGELREQTFIEWKPVIALNESVTVLAQSVSDTYCAKEISDTASISLLGAPKPIIYGDSSLCIGEEAAYTAQHDYIFNWQINTGAQLGDDFWGNYLEVTWIEPGLHDIVVTSNSQDTSICPTEKTVLTVQVYDYPEIANKVDTNITCFDIDPEIILEPLTSEYNIVFWPEQNDYSRSLTVQEEGIYEYVITSEKGCENSGLFLVLDKCETEIYIADAFTPNGDNINDYLEVFGFYLNLELEIYNIYGELIITLQEDQFPWDGKVQGENLPNGTYLWIAKCDDQEGNVESKKGKLTLIR